MEEIKREASSGEDIADDINKRVENNIMMPVYYIKSTNDETVLVGINVTIQCTQVNQEKNILIKWYDTSHDRIMRASEIEWKGKNFSFRRIEQEGGGVYYFTPMTIEIYNDKVKQYLIAGTEFTDEDSMIKAFLSTSENGY